MLNTRTRRIHVFLKCLCLLLTMAMINGCMGGGKGGKDFTLSVNIVGRGSVNIPDAGDKIAPQTVVNIEVIPEEGWAFAFWDGPDKADVVHNPNAPGGYQILMNRNISITAVFGRTLSYGGEFTAEDDNTAVVLQNAVIKDLPKGAAVSVRKANSVPLHDETPAGEPLEITVSNLGGRSVEFFIEATSSNAVMAYYDDEDDNWEYVYGSTTVKIGDKWYVHTKVENLSVYCPMLLSANLIAAGIDSIDAPLPNETLLMLPSVPDGFGVSVHSSSDTDVIALTGAIQPPENDTEVEVVLIITQGAKYALTRSIKVTVPGRVGGRTISVPKDYSTIQAAIDAAEDGDTIVAAPGTYRETINFKGKNIILQSEDPLDPEVVAS